MNHKKVFSPLILRVLVNIGMIAILTLGVLMFFMISFCVVPLWLCNVGGVLAIIGFIFAFVTALCLLVDTFRPWIAMRQKGWIFGAYSTLMLVFYLLMK